MASIADLRMFKMLLFHDIADPEGRASRKLSKIKDCRDVKGQENVSDRILTGQ
jgi:hypothetical protein